MRVGWRQILSALVVVVCSSLGWASDRAAILAGTCFGCHGPDGSSRGPATPTIAGMLPEIFFEQMVSFRERVRFGTVMNRIAAGYSDEEIRLMADYFARLPFQRQAQPFDPQLASKGQQLHQQYCEKCHRDGGRQNEDAAIVAGQWLAYLEFQIEDYLNGRRYYFKRHMKDQLEALRAHEGAEGVRAVLHYFASQK